MNNFNGIKSKLERAKELDGVLRQKSMERMNYCKHEFRKKTDSTTKSKIAIE